MNNLFSLLLFQSIQEIWSINGIIILVLSSSVLAAGLTSFINWLITNRTYKNEYYKIILNKRIATYTKFDLFIGAIQEHYKTDNIIILRLFREKEHLLKIAKLQENLALDFRWLSNEIIDEYVKLWAIILEIRDKMNADGYSEEEEITLSKGIRVFVSDLFEKSEKDFKNLHKINKFLNTNKTRK